MIKTTKQTSAEAITYPQVSGAWLHGSRRKPTLRARSQSVPTNCKRGALSHLLTAQMSSVTLQVVRNIVAKDGLVNGLLIRGLGTKILANGLQGMMFTVLWRLGQDWWAKKEQQQ